jgi:hypothetical protein
VRRPVGSVFVVPAGALIAALTAVYAMAQPATRPLTLRPSIEDSEEPRETPPVAPRRADPRPAGALPNFDNPETRELPRFGNPSGFGAGRTGYLSTNPRVRPNLRRDGLRRPTVPGRPGTTTPAPLTAAGTRATAPLLRPTVSGTAVRSAASPTTRPATTKPETTPPETPVVVAAPRNPLVRIPDGTAGGGVSGTVSTTRLTAESAALLRRRTAVDEDAFAALGGHAGTFLVLPALEVTGGYDTNPDRTPSGRPSAFVTVSPELLARSDWQRHEVTAALRGSYTAYDKTPDLDRPSVDGKVTGRFDVTRNTALIGEGILIVGTDNPGSPNVQAGLTRLPIFTTLGGAFGLTQRFNRVEVTAKGTAERTEYQPSQFTDGTTQSNDDRNYNRFGGTLRTSYDLMPGLKPFVEFGADTREYDLQFDSSGLQRSSNGWFAKGGSAFEFSRKLTGEASIGWINRKYVDPSLQELNGFLFDAALIYSMNALTRFKLLATTVASETTVAGTSGVLTRNAGIEVEHAFRRWLIGAVKFNYGLDDYVGSVRKDNRYSVSGVLTYKLNRMAQVRGEVRQEWLRSNVPNVDYAASVFLLGMRLQY